MAAATYRTVAEAKQQGDWQKIQQVIFFCLALAAQAVIWKHYHQKVFFPLMMTHGLRLRAVQSQNIKSP